MAKRIRNPEQARFLVEEFSRLNNSTNSNPAAFLASPLLAIADALASQINVRSDLHEAEVIQASNSALQIAAKQKSNQFQVFENELEVRIEEIYKKAFQKFSVLTKTNFDDGGGRFGFQKRYLYILKQLPKKYDYIRDLPLELTEQLPDKEGVWIKASGSFRSETVAGQVLSTFIERTFACVNVLSNNPDSTVYPESRRAQIRTGERYLLYNESNQKFSQQMWTNEYFDSKFAENVKTAQLVPSREFLRKQQRKFPRNPLMKSALNASHCLNSSWLSRVPHESVALIWLGFETLFSMPNEGQAIGTKVCRRASMFEQESKLRETLMLRFMNSRNRITHQKAGSEPMEGWELAKDSSRLLIWLVRWFLANGHRFESKQDFLAWLDLGKDKTELRNAIKLRKLAIRHWPD